MNIKSIITLCIALYGAILSTYSFIINRRDKFARVKVVIDDDQIYSGRRTGPVFIKLKAINKGLVDVTFDTAFIKVKGKDLFFSPTSKHVNFSYTLQSGKMMQILCEPEDLAIEFQKKVNTNTIKIKGIFEDNICKKYMSKTIKFHINYFLRNY